MKKSKIILVFVTILIGIFIPFIPYLVVIEMFFLLVPFAVIGIVSLIYLVISFVKEKMNSRKALFRFSILPIFIISQLVSGFIVDKIQRFRSNKVIAEIEQLKSENGIVPDEYELIAGLEYSKMKDDENYVIEYSRGFMVTEKYNSESGKWNSFGWND